MKIHEQLGVDKEVVWVLLEAVVLLPREDSELVSRPNQAHCLNRGAIDEIAPSISGLVTTS